jgi:hypothetical protein
MSAWKRSAPAPRRAESAQWWQDLQPGHAASGVSGADDADDYYAAMLWLPNPDSRRGWELHGVERKADEKAPPSLGFRGKE